MENHTGDERGGAERRSRPHGLRQKDSQLGGVLGDVVWYLGELLVGAVDRGALAAALLGAGQVCEAVPSELAAVILCTWSRPQAQRQRQSRKPNPLPSICWWRFTRHAAGEKVVTRWRDFEMRCFCLEQRCLIGTNVADSDATFLMCITSECCICITGAQQEPSSRDTHTHAHAHAHTHTHTHKQTFSILSDT